jgi:hypothetical protein
MVQGLEISLGERKLFVPPSSYLSMFDVKRVSLRFEKGSFVLKIDAGDGSESAFGLIYFDKKGIFGDPPEVQLPELSSQFQVHPPSCGGRGHYLGIL